MKSKTYLVVVPIILCCVLIVDFCCCREDPAVRSLDRKIEETKDILMMHNALKDADAATGFFQKLIAVNSLQFKTADGKVLVTPEEIASYWIGIKVAAIEVSVKTIADVPGAVTDYDRDKKAHVIFEYRAEKTSYAAFGLDLASTFLPDNFNPFMPSYENPGTGTLELYLFHIKRCTSD